MKTEDFMHEMTQTGAIFGRNQDVSVVFQGDQACTDGKNIILPALPAGVEYDRGTIMAMRGYLDHEAGHIRHSDMKLVTPYGNAVGNACFSLWNSLEDIWMERKVRDEYPGSEKNLTAIMSKIKDQEIDFIKKHPEEYGDNATVANAGSVIRNLGRKDYHDKELFEFTKNASSERLNAWGEKWLEELDKCKNTKEVMNLANSIYELLQKEEQQQDQEDKGEDQEDSGTSMGGMEPSEFSFDPEGDPIEGGKAKDKQEGREALGKAASAPLEDLSKFASDTLKSETDKFWKDNPQVLSNTVPYKILSTKWDEVFTKTSKNKRKDPRKDLLTSKTVQDYENVRTRLSGSINTMKSRLRRALMAKERRDWDFGKEYGKLDSKRLISGIQGNPSIYKVRKDRLEYDTSVLLLVDLSGSMGRNKIKTACESVVAFSECLEGTNIKFSVYGFDNSYHHQDKDLEFSKLYSDAVDSGVTFHRTEPQNIFEFKSFNEPLRAAKGSISAIADCAFGNNADRDAVLWCFHKLKQQPSKRKVLMVLSDGQPCHDSLNLRSHRDNTVTALKQMVERDKEFGVECVGIGILDATVKQIYKKSVSIQKVEDLSGTIFNKLSEVLLDGGVKF